jgi:peptidoglycan/LPS O-acetylase OafA/YrhL
MRDRDLAPVAAVAALVCCGGFALAAALVGGVALASVGRFTAVTVVGLGLVVLIAHRLDRRRHRGAPSDPPDAADRSSSSRWRGGCARRPRGWRPPLGRSNGAR